MPKGLYTQSACVLLERPVTLDEIEVALQTFENIKRGDPAEHWAFGGPTLLMPLREEANGVVTVDIVDQPWPDEMGDPENQPEIFTAWTAGQFGPFAFPGGLARAAEQSWIWEEAESVQSQHKAFIRVRSTYVMGADEDAPVVPEDYDPDMELDFITRVAAALLDLPGALCYFNPNGEVLRDQDGLRESLNFGWSNELPPLDAWSNVRLFRVNEDWSLMDTVGNAQLDLPDLEACFFNDAYDPGEVDNLLRNLTLYLLQEGEVIEDGDTLDGPGEITWQVMMIDDPLCDPPRDVLRWMPLDDRPVPDEITQSGEDDEDDEDDDEPLVAEGDED